MEYYHDKPASEGMVNALKRARQMIDIEWTPVARFPCGYGMDLSGKGKTYINAFFPPYRPQRGMNYSSVRIQEKYVGFNVSFETFITAVANPNSVLYTRPQHGQGKGMYSYYGIVCSAFVSYVLDLPYQVPCAHWLGRSDVTLVDTNDLDGLQLCDIVLNPTDHIAIITDIARDENGHIHTIDVSESVMPECVGLTYTPESFRKYWLENGYCVCRYANVHKATYTPSPYVYVQGDPPLERPETNKSLLPDLGNNANYQRGVELVELSVLESGWDHVEVTNPDGSTAVYPLTTRHIVTAVPGDVGHYSACCVKEKTRSPAVQWHVVDACLKPDKSVYCMGEPIQLSFDNPCGDRVVVGIICNSLNYARLRKYPTAEEMETGVIALETKDLPGAGNYWLKLVFQNEYGMYACGRCGIRVVK